MIFHRLGLINKNQRGVTLMGIIVAVAITGIIAGATTTTIFQVFSGNARTSNHMSAVKQVQNAGYWISHDAQMAQSVEPTADPDPDGFPLTLTWRDWDGTQNVVVTYTIVGGELKRSHSINGGTAETAIIAQFLDPDPVNTRCSLTGGGNFTLPDKDDAFTITGGGVADSGKITVTKGSVTLGGTGTIGGTAPNYTWSTAAGQTITVTAKVGGASGVWTSTTASARVAITADGDGNATVTGGKLVFRVTATVGGWKPASETRVYEVVPRPSRQ